MQSNIIKKNNKVSIYDKLDHSIGTVLYHEMIDYYEQKCMKEDIKRVNKNFCKTCSKYFFKNMGIDFDISFHKITFKKLNDDTEYIKNNFFMNFFKVNLYKNLGFVFISYDIILFIIEHLFGGVILYNTLKTFSKTLSSSEIIIIRKLFSVFITQYFSVWNKNIICDKFKLRFRNCDLLDQKLNINLKNRNDFFITCVFNVRKKNFCSNFGISLPVSTFYKLRNELYDKDIKNNLYFNNNKIWKNFLKIIVYNCNLTLRIVLVNSYCILSKILKWRVGDVLSINFKDDVIAYSENKPLLVGKYKTFEDKNAFFFINFVN